MHNTKVNSLVEVIISGHLTGKVWQFRKCASCNELDDRLISLSGMFRGKWLVFFQG